MVRDLFYTSIPNLENVIKKVMKTLWDADASFLVQFWNQVLILQLNEDEIGIKGSSFKQNTLALYRLPY